MKQIRILSLGDEAVRTSHNYLPKLAKSDGVDIVAGTVFKPSATLQTHIQALNGNLQDYCFICNKEGSVRFDTTENCSVFYALDWTVWDYVIIQQGLCYAGDADSYIPCISVLEKMIKEICPSAKIVLCVPSVSGADEACRNVLYNSNIEIILPVSYACQIAEENGIYLYSDDETRLSREIDFLEACVCYEVLTGKDVSLNNYRLPFVESEIASGIKKSVHSVVSSVRCFYGR